MPIQGNKTKINKQTKNPKQQQQQAFSTRVLQKKKKYAIRLLIHVIRTLSICLAFEGGN